MVHTCTKHDMKTRAVPAIALRRFNGVGVHYFMSLYSEKRIHGFKWENLPIDEYAIDRVEDLASEEEHAIMHNGMPSFDWIPGVTISDGSDDEAEGILTIARDVRQDILNRYQNHCRN